MEEIILLQRKGQKTSQRKKSAKSPMVHSKKGLYSQSVGRVKNKKTRVVIRESSEQQVLPKRVSPRLSPIQVGREEEGRKDY